MDGAMPLHNPMTIYTAGNPVSPANSKGISAYPAHHPGYTAPSAHVTYPVNPIQPASMGFGTSTASEAGTSGTDAAPRRVNGSSGPIRSASTTDTTAPSSAGVPRSPSPGSGARFCCMWNDGANLDDGKRCRRGDFGLATCCTGCRGWSHELSDFDHRRHHPQHQARCHGRALRTNAPTAMRAAKTHPRHVRFSSRLAHAPMGTSASLRTRLTRYPSSTSTRLGCRCDLESQTVRFT